MKRRNFMKFLIWITGGLASGKMMARESEPSGISLSSQPVMPEYRPSITSAWIEKDKETKSILLLDQIIKETTDFSWLNPGDKVLIKLALNSGNPFPATSDPWVLRRLIQLLYQEGAGEVLVGDQSGIASVDWRDSEKKEGSSRELCEKSGLLQVIEEEGATPIFFEEAGYEGYFESKPQGSHHWSEPLYVTKAILKAEHLIYLPRVGSHMMGDITAALKLPVGFLREESRGSLHKGGKYFNAMYEEINHIPEIESRLRFILTSGRQLISTMGPDRGSISEPSRGLIFASQDLLASELLAYTWLEWNRAMETSAFSRLTMGNLAGMRSFANRRFVTFTWGGSAPDVSHYIPGNIYNHPAIKNALRRKGGRPAKILLKSLNGWPDIEQKRYFDQQLMA